jgi:cleavage and polyadenylation specificity factor subunit 1
LLGWTNAAAHQLRRKQSDAGFSDEESDVDDMLDDDDLYNDTTPAVKKISSAAAEPSALGSYTFRTHDLLPSIAPINEVVLHPGPEVDSLNKGEIVASTGRGAAGAITTLNRELHPIKLAQTELESAKGLWAVHAKKAVPQGVSAAFGEDTEANMSSDVDYDQYLVVCRAGEDGNEVTTVYEVNGNELTATDKGDFEREEGSTLSVGVLARGTKVVQVMRTEIRTYDSGMSSVEVEC